jgi:hypothetical protein
VPEGCEDISYSTTCHPRFAHLRTFTAVFVPAQVWFSLQGEMSATVMYYPQQYVELMEVMRGRLLEGRPDSWAPNVKIGLQMNYNKLCACVTEDAIHPDFETSLAKVGEWLHLYSIY